MGNVSSNITFESLRNNWKWKPNHSQDSDSGNFTEYCFQLMKELNHRSMQIPFSSSPLFWVSTTLLSENYKSE